MDLNLIKKSDALIEDGVWATFFPEEFTIDEKDAPKLKIRSGSYKPYNNFIEAKQRRLGRKFDRDARKIVGEGLAKYIWIESKNLDDDGTPVTTEDQRAKVLYDFPELQIFVIEEMNKTAAYQAEDREQDAAAIKEGGEVGAKRK